MPATSMRHDDKDVLPSALPPLPPNHEWKEGDLVEMPIYGKGKIRGRLKHIDMTFRKKRYHGLVLIGDDGLYYELHPDIAKKVKSK